MGLIDIDMDDFRARHAAIGAQREDHLAQMNDLIERLRELVGP